jgi:hypothetical protein
MKRKKYPKLGSQTLPRERREKVSEYIEQEYRAGRRGKQAVAIGFSREEAERRKSKIDRIVSKYL